jgi:hypothetical protein
MVNHGLGKWPLEFSPLPESGRGVISERTTSFFGEKSLHNNCTRLCSGYLEIGEAKQPLLRGFYFKQYHTAKYDKIA